TCLLSFFFNDSATTDIYTLSLHDALPISLKKQGHAPSLVACDLQRPAAIEQLATLGKQVGVAVYTPESGEKNVQRVVATALGRRSEEHTSELQSRSDLVCRLLLEKKNKQK